MLIDESGLLMAPLLRRTWALRGQRPVLQQAGAHRQKVSLSVTIEVKQAHATDQDRPVLESMKLQLRDTYLTRRRTTHGIYIVGWYFCPAFRPRGHLRGRPDLKSIETARAYFDSQAKEISIGDFSLKSAVLDCRWLDSISARVKRAK